MSDRSLREKSQDQLLEYAVRMRKRAEKAEKVLQAVRDWRHDAGFGNVTLPHDSLYETSVCRTCEVLAALDAILDAAPVESPEGSQ